MKSLSSRPAPQNRHIVVDLPLVKLSFGDVQSAERKPRKTYRLTFLSRSGTKRGEIDVDFAEAQQFVAEIAVVMAAIAAGSAQPRVEETTLNPA